MPDPPIYQFIPATPGQDQPRRELLRLVRSQAASVSRQEHASRQQQTRGTRLSRGEGIIQFDDESSREEQDASAAAGPSSQRSLQLSSDQSSQRLTFDGLAGYSFSPVSDLPTYHKPYLPGLMNHYISNLTIPTPEIDGSTTIPLFRGAWIPIVLHDPVIFQVVVLFAATHYATYADPSQYDQVDQELLSLKESALSILIQRVSQDLNSFPSDTVIAAAAKMASYEAIFGTPDAVSSPSSIR